tara:strand:- start:784 stop:1380 length:597 start_codon:yes stop_codon:yes gene_type:complete
VTERKKKILFIQILIFIFACTLIFFSYYNQNVDISKNSIKKPDLTEEKLPSDTASKNTFNDVEYKGVDLSGNRYSIKSKVADFEIEKPELINMQIMKATFYFKDGTILTVTGDRGTYNNKTNNMTFRDNIIALYEDYEIYSDNLDYFNTKSLLMVYGNVKSMGNEGKVEADNLKVDLSAKTIDLSMLNNNNVKVNLKK